MKLRLIPPGKFTMGSSPQEIKRINKRDAAWREYVDYNMGQGPEHEVEITQPLYMGIHEVTLGQFRQFVKDRNYQVGNDQWLQPGVAQTDDHPVMCVTWQSATDFCAWLSKKEGKHYRLPTEAEWEYCCRAGRNGLRYSFGDDDDDLGSHAWYDGNSGRKTHPVGTLKPNAWGLVDMHGNALEWCQDYYDRDYYKTSPRQNPAGLAGPAGEARRVLRGGGYYSWPQYCRSAFRMGLNPSATDLGVGFRVAIVGDLQAKAPPADLVTPDTWFTLEVIAQGKRIIVKLNDQTALDHTAEKWTTKPGVIAIHQLDKCGLLKIRKIEIKELPVR